MNYAITFHLKVIIGKTMLEKVFLFIVILNITRLTLSETNLLAPRSYCGFQHTDDYSRDNDNITLDEFPWIAQLLYNEERSINCVGSLINSRYVLTLAICAFPSLIDYPKLMAVRLGDFNLQTSTDCQSHTKFGEECSDPVQEFSIEKMIPHPKFNRESGAYDIALIRLSKDVGYSEYIRPICLPTSKDMDLAVGTELALSGWGKVSFGQTHTPIKKKVLAELISLDECKMLYNNSGIPGTIDYLCALEGSEIFSCKSDGGSPLMLSVKKQWEQVGVVGYGQACGLNFPSVYVKISSYLDWIKENLRE